MALPTRAAPRDLRARCHKLHVLIADDEPMLREIIGEFLETLDFCSFAEANDGAEALAYLRAHPVDCLLSDIKMPRMNLEQLLESVKREARTPVIIATSGYSDLPSVCNILERGAHEFLAKPLDLDLLEQALAWVPARSRALDLAGDLFGPGKNFDREAAFAALGRALEEESGLYAPRMRHARRVGDLAERVLGDADRKAADRLRLAALIHEVGISNEHWTTIMEPRLLAPEELHLARTQPAIAARLAAQRIPGFDLAPVIERHLVWTEEKAAEEAAWDENRRLACLLGILNVVDALLTDRPDRKAHPLERARQTLKNLYAHTNLSELKRTLSHWTAIEEYYRALGQN